MITITLKIFIYTQTTLKCEFVVKERLIYKRKLIISDNIVLFGKLLPQNNM